MNAPYALFDPHSAYSALRATLVTQEKIRGYFYWRKTRRARGEERPGPSPDRPPLVFRGGAPPVLLKARVKVPVADPLPGRYTIEVTLLEKANLPPEGAICRAFLVEQAVLDRLRARGAPAVVCREGNRLTLRDLSAGQVRASVAGGANVLAAAVLDEQRVAVLTSSGEVRVWDTVTDAIDTFVEASERTPSRAMTVTADGQVAWGTNAGDVMVLDPSTGSNRLVQRHPAPVTALAALPDGRLASAHADGVVCVDGSEYMDSSGYPVGAVAAVAQGRMAFLTSGGNVRVWTPGAEQDDTLPVLATGLASLPDGRLATAGPAGLTLWDLETSAWRMLSDAPVRSVLAAPGPRLLKIAEDESIWAWNLQTGTDCLLHPHKPRAGFVEALACGTLRPSLDGKDDLAVAQLLDHRLLSEEFRVQQAVSALPELEGRLRGDKVLLEADIPPGCPNISDRARVVVVFGDDPRDRDGRGDRGR